jgi:hypothetical protein
VMFPQVITARGQTVTVYQQGFPKTKYPKRGGGSALVLTPEQEKGLGPDWQDFPASVPEPEQPVVTETPPEHPQDTLVTPPKRRGRKPKQEQPSPPPKP